MTQVNDAESHPLAGRWSGYEVCRHCGNFRRRLELDLSADGRGGVRGSGSSRGTMTPGFTVVGSIEAGKVSLAFTYSTCTDPHDGYLERTIIYGQWECNYRAPGCRGGFKLWPQGMSEEEANRLFAAKPEDVVFEESGPVRLVEAPGVEAPVKS